MDGPPRGEKRSSAAEDSGSPGIALGLAVNTNEIDDEETVAKSVRVRVRVHELRDRGRRRHHGLRRHGEVAAEEILERECQNKPLSRARKKRVCVCDSE